MRRKKRSIVKKPRANSQKALIWVYPPNNWKSSSNKTFIYGCSDPRARLFVSYDDYLIPERINIFPNGNFAKTIRLPNVVNNIKLIQILKNKKKIVSRKIYIGKKEIRKKKGKKEPQSIKAPKYRHVGTIVIDPGHGGKEHGTHSPGGIPESHFNLQIARMLYKELKKVYKKVYITRDKNKFVSLNRRIDFAKKTRCNLLISIHHNALPDSQDPLRHSGVSLYYKYGFVKSLANKLLYCISRESGLRRYGVFRRDFALTRPRFCKAVLLECGFLTHPIEAEFVTKQSTQEKIVRGIVKALL